MANEGMGRRLTAILAADIADYSRLMGTDEARTVRDLKAHQAVLLPMVSGFGGRIIDTAGDGILAEFASAVQAIECAVAVQNTMAERNATVDHARRMRLRIGVNIGDVICDEARIYGDGINVAARLEGIAEPGGICVSSAAYDQVRGKVGVEFIDLGEQSLKNIALPVRAYAVVRDGAAPATLAEGIRPGPLSPPRLSMVVLPFANLSGDPEQDYFADGVTESLTTDLSRIRGSFVIGRHTAFTYKGKSIDLKKVGRELNVRYVLEGSVQRSGKRLRVNVQLVDAEPANHLWAERFDTPIADLFDMQDEIVSRLASALNAQLIEAEARRAERSLHPNSMDLYFQGRAWFNKGPTPENMTQARGFFARALTLDPGNIEATVGIAAVDASMGAAQQTDERTALLSAAETNAIKALSLIPDHASAHLVLGLVYISTNRAAQGIAECEQALALNRNLANAHGTIGVAKYHMGRAAETEGHILEALRLSPLDITAYLWKFYAGLAKMQLGADAEAVGWLRRSIEANRNFSLAHFALAAALGLLGALDEARTAARAGLALNPSLTIRRVRAAQPSDNPTYLAARERVYEGARLAGVPEG